jgi:hypothetical protein
MERGPRRSSTPSRDGRHHRGPSPRRRSSRSSTSPQRRRRSSSRDCGSRQRPSRGEVLQVVGFGHAWALCPHVMPMCMQVFACQRRVAAQALAYQHQCSVVSCRFAREECPAASLLASLCSVFGWTGAICSHVVGSCNECQNVRVVPQKQEQGQPHRTATVEPRLPWPSAGTCMVHQLAAVYSVCTHVWRVGGHQLNQL